MADELNKRDLNNIPTIAGVTDDVDKEIRVIKVDPTSGGLQVNVLSNLIPTAYDYIALSYTGSNLTGVVYKTGGSGGTTIATLALAYTGSTLDSVTRT